MPLLEIVRVNGSSGATRCATHLAATWPEVDRVLVEADPAGGVLAAEWRLQSRPSMVDVSASLVTGRGEDAVLDAGVQETKFLGERLKVVCAPIGQPTAHAALAKVLAQNPNVFTPSDRWVIADLGRIAPESITWPLLARADAIVVVAAGTVAGVLALRAMAGLISAECGPRWAVAVVPDVYGADEINGALVDQEVHVPVFGDLPPAEPSGRTERRRARLAWSELASACVELSARAPLAIESGGSVSAEVER